MLAEFIKKSDKPFLVLWKILGVIILMPAVIIHEAGHLFMILVTQCKVHIDIKKWLFLDKVQVMHPLITGGYEYKNEIHRFSFPIFLQDTNYFKHVLVALGPIIGIIFYCWLCYLIPTHLHYHHKTISMCVWYLMFYYFFFNLDYFWLSSDDIKALKNGWKESKIKIKYYQKEFFIWRKNRIFTLLKLELKIKSWIYQGH